MAFTEKYLGVIGYAFLIMANFLQLGYGAQTVAGLISIIGAILVAISWILLGMRLKDSLFYATGILLITSLLALGIVIGLFFSPEMASVGALLVLAVVILAVISSILHLLSHLRAGEKLRIKTFTWAGYVYIVSVILGVVELSDLLPLLPYFLKQVGLLCVISVLGHFLWTFVGSVLVNVVCYVLSCLSFYSIKDEIEEEIESELPEQVEEAEEILCPNCGAELEEDSTFCPKCGTKIKEEGE